MADPRPIAESVAKCVITAIARERRVKAGDLRGATREEPVVSYRAEAMWILRQFGVSSSVVGRLFYKDHSTVLAACKQVEVRFTEVNGYKAEVDAVLAVARECVEGAKGISLKGQPPLRALLEMQAEAWERVRDEANRNVAQLRTAITQLDRGERVDVHDGGSDGR